MRSEGGSDTVRTVPPRLGTANARFTSLDARFTTANTLFTSLNARFASRNARPAGIGARLANGDARFTICRRIPADLAAGTPFQPGKRRPAHGIAQLLLGGRGAMLRAPLVGKRAAQGLELRASVVGKLRHG